MPYVSKADRERAQWMTLREAVEHVRAIEKCSAKEALRQIASAVNDHAVGAVYEDSEGRPLPQTPMISGSRRAPRPLYRRPLLALDEHHVQSGTFELPAIDEASLTQKGRELLAAGKFPEAEERLVVLLLRETVFRIWGGEPKVVPLAKPESPGSKGGRPSRGHEIGDVLRNADLNQPDKVLIALVHEKLGNGPGLSDDVIREEIGKLRHPPG
ncbi:MAG: hypothetical protein ACREFP_11285 [Acetobacteraceae bacterium]